MWYDLFALFYDQALERHYRAVREDVIEELHVTPGSVVLDVACGTGQNFPIIQRFIQDGVIVGVDLSKGMLRKARQRVEDRGWQNVRLHRSPILDFSADDLQSITGRTTVDFVVCTLGLTVIPDWVETVNRCLDLLHPGGRIVLFDAYIEKPIFRTRCANIFARADLSRKFWEPLEDRVSDFRLVELPGSQEDYGGDLFLASGAKR